MLSTGKTYKNYSAAFRNWLRNNQFDKKDTNVQQKQDYTLLIVKNAVKRIIQTTIS